MTVVTDNVLTTTAYAHLQSIGDGGYTVDYQASVDDSFLLNPEGQSISLSFLETVADLPSSVTVQTFQTDSDQSTVTTLESAEEKQLGDSSIGNQLHYHQHNAETGSQPHVAGCFSDNVDFEEVEVDEEEDLDIILHDIPAENIIETSTASTSQHDSNYVQEKEGGKT